MLSQLSSQKYPLANGSNTRTHLLQLQRASSLAQQETNCPVSYQWTDEPTNSPGNQSASQRRNTNKPPANYPTNEMIDQQNPRQPPNQPAKFPRLPVK
jgi:hypothetical protein